MIEIVPTRAVLSAILSVAFVTSPVSPRLLHKPENGARAFTGGDSASSSCLK